MKGLTSHKRDIRSYLQVQMWIGEDLDENLSEIRILTILYRIIRIKIQEGVLSNMLISRNVIHIVV